MFNHPIRFDAHPTKAELPLAKQLHMESCTLVDRAVTFLNDATLPERLAFLRALWGLTAGLTSMALLSQVHPLPRVEAALYDDEQAAGAPLKGWLAEDRPPTDKDTVSPIKGS